MYFSCRKFFYYKISSRNTHFILIHLFTDYPDYSAQYANYSTQVKYENEYDEARVKYEDHENGQNYSKEEGEYDE